MPVNHFTATMVYGRLGSAVRIASGAKVFVEDVTTGLTAPALTQNSNPVQFLTADANGTVEFTADVSSVKLLTPAGELVVHSQESLASAATAAASAAASAASAAALAPSNGGRAVGHGELEFSVKHEGAAGNGSIDDTAAINAAIAKANVQGAIVRLPRGTYKVSAALTPLANGVELRGDGPYATVIRTTSTTANVITSTGTFLVGVRDLQIESLVTRTAGSGVAFTNVEGYVIDNVRMIDPYNCGTFSGCHSGWLSRIKVAHGTGTLNRGFYWINCVDTHVQQFLSNGGTNAFGAGKAWFTVDSGCDTWTGLDLGACASSGSGLGLLLTHSLSPASFAPRWIKVTNFFFEGAHGGVEGYNGIQIENALSAYFTNGYTATSSRGLTVTGGRDIKFNQVSFKNSWLWGATVGGTAGPYDVHFTDCTFDSNSQGATNSFAHLAITGDSRNVRVDNCIFGNQVVGQVAKPNYAIEVAVPFVQDLRVTDCRFDSTQYGTGIIGGTVGLPGMVARTNRGLNPRGLLGPPAIPATTVAHTNAYGADATVHVTGGTVSGIAVQGVTTGLTSGSFRVPAGSTITLTYTVAPTWVWIGE